MALLGCPVALGDGCGTDGAKHGRLRLSDRAPVPGSATTLVAWSPGCRAKTVERPPGEVLNVISRSPSQLQPVFDFIAYI